MSLHPGEVLIRPVVSEKSYEQIAQNRYTFKVHKDAHKTQIRQAVEQLFDVKVVRVNIVKVQPKPKRRGATRACAPAGRRPIVQLKPGDRSRSSKERSCSADPPIQADLAGPPLHVGLRRSRRSRSRSRRRA